MEGEEEITKEQYGGKPDVPSPSPTPIHSLCHNSITFLYLSNTLHTSLVVPFLLSNNDALLNVLSSIAKSLEQTLRNTKKYRAQRHVSMKPAAFYRNKTDGAKVIALLVPHRENENKLG